MPVPCEPRSTGLPDRMARRTSAPRRWRRPRHYHQGRQILLHRAAGPLWIAIPAPILTCDRALLVGVGLDQARVDCKAFAANQTGCNTSLDDALEDAAKNLSLTEALIAGTRKHRMIGDSVLDAEPAEPAVGKIHLHFATEQPFRTDRKNISHDQHPDHQFRIDRRAPHRRIVRCKFSAKPGQVESGLDLAHQMIFRNSVAQMKLVEQLTLVTLQTLPSSIDLAIRVNKTESRFEASQQNLPTTEVAEAYSITSSARVGSASHHCSALQLKRVQS